LLLAALQLRDALQGSGPFAEPLDMLKALAEQDAALMPIIEPLERRASAGLPSLRDLQAAFPPVARRIAAIEVGREGEGWTAGVLRRVAEAVNLRPVGLVEGDAPTAVAARAEVKLNDGDLAGAVAEIATLEGAAAEAAANWRADAEARLAANRAVSALGALVAERFSGMAGG
ncbi:MAG: mitofilin family membrane protein, partial [Kiloniellaceae bacterium]